MFSPKKVFFNVFCDESPCRVFFDRQRVQSILHGKHESVDFVKHSFVKTEYVFWVFIEKITDCPNTSFLSSVVLFKIGWVNGGEAMMDDGKSKSRSSPSIDRFQFSWFVYIFFTSACSDEYIALQILCFLE